MNENEPNKIRVLIADERKVFQLGLQNTIEQSSAIEVVGTGKKVLEQIESFTPDVVIFDAIALIMDDGVQTTEELTRTYPNVKIIFISSSVEYERIALALKAGASGYLKKETLELDLVPAILAVNRDNVYFSPEIIPILEEGKYSVDDEANYFRQFQLLLNQELKNWLNVCQLSLAKEIITKWRFAEGIPITPHEVIVWLEIDLSEARLINISPQNPANPQNSLITKLHVVVKEIKRAFSLKNTFSSESLNQAKLQTQRWFDEVESEIRNSAQRLRLSKMDELKQFMAPYWQRGSPESLIVFFEELLKLLLSWRNKYEQNRVSCLSESNDAFKAFTRLSELVDEPNNLIEQQDLWSSGFRAISIGYEYQLKSIVYDAITQIVVGLIYCCQNYLDSLTKTNNLLKQVQTSLLSDLKPVLDLLDSKNKIEVWFGHRLNQWGNSPSLSPDSLKEQLLSKIALTARLDRQIIQTDLDCELSKECRLS